MTIKKFGDCLLDALLHTFDMFLDEWEVFEEEFVEETGEEFMVLRCEAR